jgi:hypothetical protein
MKKIILGVLAAATVAAPHALSAATANADAVSTASDCKPVAAHTEYKWVPNVTNAGPTQWTTDNPPANTQRNFPWKGKDVAYHRDGTKSQVIDSVTCAITQPMPTYSADGCSVTMPYVPGIDTRLYGVNGYPETNPITKNVTVTGSLEGSNGTAPQFWVGYTAKPGYVITNSGAAPTHFDFYNGDDVRDCDGYQSFTMDAASQERIDLPAVGFKTMTINVNGETRWGGTDGYEATNGEMITTYVNSTIVQGSHRSLDSGKPGGELVAEGTQVGAALYRLDDGPWQPVTNQPIQVADVAHVWVTYNDRPDDESFADNSGAYDVTATRTK